MKYLDWKGLSKISVLVLFLCFCLANAEGILDEHTVPEIVSWQITTLIAVIISFTLVILGYIITFVLQDQHLNTLFKQELIQVMFTGIGLVILLFILGVFEIGLMPAINTELGGTGTTLHESSQSILDLKLEKAEIRFEGLISYTDYIAEQGSKYASCSFWGVGFYIGGCSALNVIMGPLTTVLSAFAIGITDIFALSILNNVALLIYTFLLPLGIFFRTFHVSRQFGGFLIAVAIGFGIVFPASVLFLEYVYVDFLDNELGIPGGDTSRYIIDDSAATRCDEFKPDFDSHIKSNLGGGKYVLSPTPPHPTIYVETIGILNEETLDILAAEFILGTLLYTLILMIILLVFIASTVSFFGGTIDLTALARLSV